ncbi:hypothetical protein DPEC_G00209800, partial [Dallia pectoralis]
MSCVPVLEVLDFCCRRGQMQYPVDWEGCGTSALYWTSNHPRSYCLNSTPVPYQLIINRFACLYS